MAALVDASVLIVATALAKGFDVVTRDRRSFPKIPDLAVRLR